MKLVIIESPYQGDIERNIEYAKKCMFDSLQRGEAPFASHLLYPQVLDDAEAVEREQGIKAGLEWGKLADLTAVYTDHGISHGVQQGIDDAVKNGRQIEYRTLNSKVNLPVRTYFRRSTDNIIAYLIYLIGFRLKHDGRAYNC